MITLCPHQPTTVDLPLTGSRARVFSTAEPQKTREQAAEEERNFWGVKWGAKVPNSGQLDPLGDLYSHL
jgi:hypothetical protein